MKFLQQVMNYLLNRALTEGLVATLAAILPTLPARAMVRALALRHEADGHGCAGGRRGHAVTRARVRQRRGRHDGDHPFTWVGCRRYSSPT